MKQTRIVSAFPGTGKTHAFKSGEFDCIDSDSSLFSWTTDDEGRKVRNPNFPRNYVNHIRENVGKVDFIFVSTHKEVRDALRKSCLYFYLVYPHDDLKDEYVRRFKERGSPQSFIDLVESQFEEWACELTAHEEKMGCCKVRLTQPDEYLDVTLRHMLSGGLL